MLWDFIINRIPWWIQAGILAAVVGVPVYLVSCMLIGTQRTNRYVLHGIGAIALVAVASKIRQAGYKARLAEEERAAKVAEDVAEEERREAEGLPDVKLNEKVDKWSRP